MLTAFLQRHWGAGKLIMHIALLNSVSRYVPWLGIPTSPWDDVYLNSKGGVTCGAVRYANWLTSILHQIGAAFYVFFRGFPPRVGDFGNIIRQRIRRILRPCLKDSLTPAPLLGHVP